MGHNNPTIFNQPSTGTISQLEPSILLLTSKSNPGGDREVKEHPPPDMITSIRVKGKLERGTDWDELDLGAKGYSGMWQGPVES